MRDQVQISVSGLVGEYLAKIEDVNFIICQRNIMTFVKPNCIDFVGRCNCVFAQS